MSADLDQDPRRLWLMQLRLEGKRLTDDGRLVRGHGKDPDDIPIAALTRFRHGSEWIFAESTSTADAGHFRRLATDDVFTGRELPAIGDLSAERCSTYRLSAQAHASPARWAGPESYAVHVDDQEVAWASSSRTDDECAELWVRTDPSHQRRGYARLAAIAWAAEVITSGRIAFYSHHLDNEPSRRLVQRLGGVRLFDLASFAHPRPTGA